jgi:small subunit ribosomal protein S4
MKRPKGKIERRLGENLFLKGHRCLGPKCPHARRPNPPGAHGGKRMRRSSSEFGAQLSEKQKMKWRYGLSEKEMSRYIGDAEEKSGKTTAEHFMDRVGRRLDNVVCMSGFAVSRSIARNLVVYGHIFVNGKRVKKPSYAVRKGDSIAIRPASVKSKMFEELDAYLKKYEPPSWLALDKEKKCATAQDEPGGARDPRELANIRPVIEFYSR